MPAYRVSYRLHGSIIMDSQVFPSFKDAITQVRKLKPTAIYGVHRLTKDGHRDSYSVFMQSYRKALTETHT